MIPPFQLQTDASVDADTVLASISSILADTDLCSIATVGDDGLPHINTAYFALVGPLVLYVLTAPSSAHAKNWSRDARVALTVFGTDQPWGEPHRGAQIYGAVSQIPPEKQVAAFDNYAEVHPRLRTWTENGTTMTEELESRFYEITIDRIKVSDETNFGEEPVEVRVLRTPGGNEAK